MPRTIQIRDVDDDVYASLARRAAAAGVTVAEYLRRYATGLAARPTLGDWRERTSHRRSRTTTAEVIASFDELRDPWPDAGR